VTLRVERWAAALITGGAKRIHSVYGEELEDWVDQGQVIGQGRRKLGARGIAERFGFASLAPRSDRDLGRHEADDGARTARGG
jgi:hypothetical protein